MNELGQEEMLRYSRHPTMLQAHSVRRRTIETLDSVGH